MSNETTTSQTDTNKAAVLEITFTDIKLTALLLLKAAGRETTAGFVVSLSAEETGMDMLHRRAAGTLTADGTMIMRKLFLIALTAVCPGTS